MEIKNWHMRFSALNIKKQPSTLCALTHWHACHMHYIINCHVLSELPEKGSGGGPHFRPTHVCLIVSSKAPCPGTGLSPTLWDRERRIQNTPLPDCESRRRVSQLGRNIVLEHSFGGITPAPSLSRRLSVVYHATQCLGWEWLTGSLTHEETSQFFLVHRGTLADIPPVFLQAFLLDVVCLSADVLLSICCFSLLCSLATYSIN